MAVDFSASTEALVVATPSQITIGRIAGPNILKPVNNPAFHAYKTTVAARGTIISHDAINFNVGNGYNPATGYFTAPVAGIYHLKAEVMVNQTTGDWRLYMVCAGRANRQTIFYLPFAGYHVLSVEGIYNLAKNEFVYVYYSGPADTIAGVYNNFSGHFVG